MIYMRRKKKQANNSSIINSKHTFDVPRRHISTKNIYGSHPRHIITTNQPSASAHDGYV